MPRLRIAMLVALIATVFSVQAQRIIPINSSPLRLNVGSDGSYQVYNDAVPGVGQIFPTASTLADMGVFAWVDGTLYAPNFRSRGTATGGLGSYTPWTTVTSSTAATGEGTVLSPYTVSTSLAAGETGVRVTVTTTYVRGNNYFRVLTQVTGDRAHDVDVYLGADIYLASSDQGIFVYLPDLPAVGGRSCGEGEDQYNILLIPITGSSAFTAAQYSNVWGQIGRNALNNSAEGSSCVDNGAALQWRDVMAGGQTSVLVEAAVSFGAIPTIDSFVGFGLTVEPEELTLVAGQSAELNVTVQTNSEIGFNAPVTLSAPGLPRGMSIVFEKETLPEPGDGTVKATLTTTSDVFPQIYHDVSVFGSGGNETHFDGVTVTIACTPPTVLGIKQPQTTNVRRGERATLRIEPDGVGEMTYQWYAGHAPLVGNPIAGATTATFVTPPIQEIQQYWVRVTNACGTVDSLTATVIPTN